MHEMYRTLESDILCQGDILDFEKLKPALKGHQDFVADQKHYVGFSVITQTCDLTEHRCVPFINIAVIRKLTETFSEIDLASKNKTRVTEDLLHKIIDHNENKRGYFFLHPEPLAGITEDCVVDLRVILSLYGKMHYKEVLDARVGSLSGVYANKLGWMAGHLFSRVPTKDWNELENEEPAKDHIQQLIGVISKNPEPKLP
jgi:hypothetical protein